MVNIIGFGPIDEGSIPSTSTKLFNQVSGRGNTHLIWDQESFMTIVGSNPTTQTIAAEEKQVDSPPFQGGDSGFETRRQYSKICFRRIMVYYLRLLSVKSKFDSWREHKMSSKS